MKNLVCPHCQTTVNPKAFVCLGCGAEVVRGASRREKTTAGYLFTAIGVLITMVAMGLILPVVGARNEYGLAFVVELFPRRCFSIWQAALWSGCCSVATAFFPHLPASIAVCGGLAMTNPGAEYATRCR